MANVAIPAAIGVVSKLIGGGSQHIRREVGSKLDNLEVTRARLGSPVSSVKGTRRINGCNIFWAPPLKEQIIESTQTAGKGTGSITEVRYTYFCTFAALICVARPSEYLSLNRIWFNNEMVYNEGHMFTDEDALANGYFSDQHLEFFSGQDNQDLVFK